ncbi:2-C-methyl-D-erythritol 4-phosphate cytidylyltransferase [Desulfohalotomaculum tongense]|nr:2-C-methyl-D-erythritol 4-phosphate cytidylyltransferase [Desulforadius tongensis]
MAKVYAIIPAAGTGSRMGSKIKKQYLQLQGLPVLAHTINIFEKCPFVDGIVVVVGKEDVSWCRQEIIEKYSFQKVLSVVPGGDCRQHSVYNGLVSLPAGEDDVVMVHDGARPLVTADILADALSAVRKNDAVAAAVPVKDTIKLADAEQKVIDTPPREKLWAVQTPQVFKYRLLMKAYRHAADNDFAGTDDASLVEKLGHAVHLVSGSYENIKITTRDDMLLAELILKRRGCACE